MPRCCVGLNLPHAFAMVLVDGLAPSFTRWADDQERKILKDGIPLDARSLEFAAVLGIRRPEEVRVLRLDRIPVPVPPLAVKLAAACGLPVFAPGGMAVGRGIFLLNGQDDSLPHELVHVLQYERMGGIGPFMRAYILQCLTVGYVEAELEQEARLLQGGRRRKLT